MLSDCTSPSTLPTALLDPARARLTYQVIKRDGEGDFSVVGAGVEKGKDFGATVGDTYQNALSDLAENAVPPVNEVVNRHIKAIARKVRILVDGVPNLDTNFLVKGLLQNLAWVLKVEDEGIGRFSVSHRENPIYLAHSISQSKNFVLVDYSSGVIKARFNGPMLLP